MHTAYIGLGANLPSPAGPPEATLAAAVRRLGQIGRVLRISSLYSTEPVGYADQPRFLNAVVSLATALSPLSLLEELMGIERVFGRDRSWGIRNGPRTLDLDLLLYGDLVLHEFSLDIPHPRLAQRTFVLVPLQEIAPDLIVAPFQRTVSQLLQALGSGTSPGKDAILPIQNDIWHAGSADGSDSPDCPDAADADS